MTYHEKLKDPRWRAKRTEIIQRDGGKCRCCESENNLQVHHTVYFKNTDPWDYDHFFLLTLCELCHHQFEEHIHEIKIILALIQFQSRHQDDMDRVRAGLVRVLNQQESDLHEQLVISGARRLILNGE